ncbi:hypothetical protein PL84_02625 [Vibrio anguillarum]|uniref:hypothetical protein n=1 Tax=Vibrio anguillarum TaxID=55601 RepID=UPI00097E2D19|nr:hypothetical protein [Vibrio anguillarum]MBT2909472.1 hypothetical protein [Vibrio anguillarum]MBT2942502.1 hypothetical protein [Vibrio anguillarum]MBT2950674.1 hypothetical protein [Vibrio anguillarum]MBT2979591.1 hypothetical protein [Vibrio anguillarum]
MNRVFIIFNLIPLLLGWVGFSLDKPELVKVAMAVIAIRACLLLVTIPKMYKKFQKSDLITRRFQRRQLKKPAAVFAFSLITLCSLVAWGEMFVLSIVVLSTGMYHGMRSHIIRHSY